MKITLLFLALFISTLCFGNCNINAPQGLKSSSVASCQVTMQWKQKNNATGYQLQYKESTAAEWIVVNVVGNVNAYDVTGLLPNTVYNVKVAAVCSSNEVGAFSSEVNVKTALCSTPVDITASNINATSATVTWTGLCGTSNYNLRYRKLGTSSWITINNISAESYMLSGLLAVTAYQVRIKAKCGAKTSKYSSPVSFTTAQDLPPSRKNVLLVIVDDARFDSYQATNGPSFFHDSAMSRVAEEGVNFEESFVVQSQCAPSRASITSGLYPHIHGVTDNPTQVNSDTIYQTTLAEILHDNGYYTGLIGKYHISKHPQPGYDYWMETHGSDYTDTKYNINGNTVTIPGHKTDIVADSAIGFLKKVPANKPFYLWLAYAAPHTPLTPRPEDIGIFDAYTMPTPLSPDKYTENYPAFLYNCHAASNPDGLADFYKGYFELLNGVEVTLGNVFQQLTDMGLMDSTLIIFMSDNGYIIGEHKLFEKQLSYEESIKVPIFMRYPGLIAADTKITDNMALNIDIAPTILDFAGIPDTFSMQGISLLKMMNNTAERKEMMYEFFNKDCVPDIRAVRSFNFKYVKYNCSQVTEELFDLVTDPLELTNLVNAPAYATTLQQYRDKLSFWRNYYEDYTWDSLYTCSLTNPQRLAHAEGTPLTLLNVYPNPSSSNLVLHFISAEKNSGTLRILNELGITVFERKYEQPLTEYLENIDISSFTPGNYFALVQHGSQAYQQAFVKQ